MPKRLTKALTSRPPLVALLLVGCLFDLVGVKLAYAQTVAEGDNTLTEIVVTAEKRESTVQNTPFSITAVSGEQMSKQGLASLEGVAEVTPGISMRSSGPAQTEYDMRGLTSSGGAFATTGLYLNDIPLASPAQSFTGHVSIDPDLFDLNRVEVLRGPQGTLYGSGSMGGTIRLVANEPNVNKFEGAAQAITSEMTGGGLNYGGSVMVNLPLIENQLALRVVGTDKYTDGWIDRRVVQPFPLGTGGSCGWQTCVRGDVAAAPVEATLSRSNWERLTGGRGELLFKATDSLTIDILAMYQKISMGGFSDADVPPGPDVLAHYQPFNIAEPFDDVFRIYALTINYDLGFAKLTSAASSWNRNSTWTGDLEENNQNFIATFYGFQKPVAVPYYNSDPSKQQSEELRLTSSGGGAFQWVIGAFYSSFQSSFIQYLADPAFGAISAGGPPANPLGILYAPNQPYKIKQYAAFTEASYKITDTLQATVGFRWYRYNSELDAEQAGVFTPTGNATPSYADVSASESGNNPKLNLSYRPTKELTVYVQAAKGFRPGGVNLPVPPTCAIQPSSSYSPDSIWDYEAGEKAKLFDGRVTINSDFYYIVWKNIQQELDQSCGFPYTANSGTAVSYGPELEVSAQLSSRLIASLSGTYTQSYLRDVAGGLSGTTIGSTTPLSPGLRLDNVPHYTLNASLSYNMQVSNSYSLLTRISGTVLGPQYDISYYTQELPGYTLLNARVGLLGGALVPYLFVDNIANRHAITTINTEAWGVASPSLDRAAITTPRTFGVDLQYRF